MFIEENKLLLGKKLVQATREIGNSYISSNWSKILVYIELYCGVYSGRFIVIYDDETLVLSRILCKLFKK